MFTWFARLFGWKQKPVLPKLTKWRIEDNTWHATAHQPMVRRIAEALVRFFKRNGGINYVQMIVVLDDKYYVVSIQEAQRPDLYAVNNFMRNVLECIHAQNMDIKTVKETVAHCLLELGYIVEDTNV